MAGDKVPSERQLVILLVLEVAGPLAGVLKLQFRLLRGRIFFLGGAAAEAYAARPGWWLCQARAVADTTLEEFQGQQCWQSFLWRLPRLLPLVTLALQRQVAKQLPRSPSAGCQRVSPSAPSFAGE